MFILKNKIILVTGATGYLGSVISEGLAKAGAKVYINGRTEDSVNKIVDSLIKKGYQAKSAIFDITNYKQVDKFFSNFNEEVIDALLINALITILLMFVMSFIAHKILLDLSKHLHLLPKNKITVTGMKVFLL